MTHRHRQAEGKGALDLIEEATHLVRTAPPAALAAYWVGSVPFVVGALYFWTDMSRSPFAAQHLAASSLGLAVLFFWMKFWQAGFARGLRAYLSAEAPPAWSVREVWRFLPLQISTQASGLLFTLLALAMARTPGILRVPFELALLLPSGWFYAFYQNVTALAGSDPPGRSTLIRRSWRQAMLWPGQNHAILAILGAFAFFVLLNWTIVCLVVPQLFKMLLGVQSVFSKSPLSMLNTTFSAAMIGLTYLTVDPVIKAVYTLRCFYGGSLKSGEDLKVDLKRTSARPERIAAALAILLTFGTAANTRAADTANPSSPSPQPAVQPAAPAPELDRAIDQVIHGRKYTWRIPRERKAETNGDEKAQSGFLKSVSEWFRDVLKHAADWVGKFFRKLFSRRAVGGGRGGGGSGWIAMPQFLAFLLVVAVAVLLVFLLFRVWRDRGHRELVASEPVQPAPDVADENVGADQLPGDEWLKLARELLDRGEYRLAMRALYLATLAHLAHRELIRIARFKSNRDYEFELQRRAHALPDLLAAFDDSVSTFERIWYGMHPADRELVDRFAAGVERIKGVA